MFNVSGQRGELEKRRHLFSGKHYTAQGQRYNYPE
jgi:hypothetical protein